ncbi:GGDEF domain-containing protein [Thiocystis violacea]|uniref:GGDEF domain-containing protein n=1 Tax=Thiocystis violacea TaxID=13725 RepID=UPI001903C397|nr:diguanylate cyclase [Thiocystis violacea]MBK1724841.1 diguanylate cyclase [Thiocystis violacea]
MDPEFSAQLIDHLQVGVIQLDGEGRITSWNTWVARHSGLSTTEAAGKRLEEVFPGIQASRLPASIEQALRFRLSSMLAPGLNASILPLYNKKADRALDQRMQQLIYVTPIRHPQCACLIQVQDMTATVRRERRLRAQSSKLIATTYRDALTGVGNRRRFDHDLSQLFLAAQNEQKPLALLMIDVDDFKAYNDRFGHPKGDECLVMVARALQEGLRQKADRVSRYGGEEFGLPLPDTDLEMACVIAERLRQRVNGLKIPHPASRTGGHVTVSIGVSAMVPRLDQPADILVAQSDLALYTAKDHGRNTSVYFEPESNELRSCS